MKFLDEFQAKNKLDEGVLYRAAGKPGAVEKTLFVMVAFICLNLCHSGFGQYVFLSRQKAYYHLLEVHQGFGKLLVPVFMAYLFVLIRRLCNIKMAFSAVGYIVVSLLMYQSPAPNTFALILSGFILPGGMLMMAMGRVSREDRARACAAAVALYAFSFVLLTGFSAVNSPFRIRFLYSHRIIHAFLAPCAVLVPGYCLFVLRGSQRKALFRWNKAGAAVIILLLSAGAGAALYSFKTLELEKIREANLYPTKRLAAKDGMKFRLVPENALNGEELCSLCHPIPYRQWARSVHALAAKTMTFQKVAKELMSRHGAEIGRDCASCHDPAVALSGDPRALTDPEHVRKSQGVSCRACHYMSRSGGKNALYALEIPRSDLMLESETIRDLGSMPVGAAPAPGRGNLAARANYISLAVLEHAGDVTKPITKDGSACYPCHRLESVRKGHIKIPVDNVSSFEASEFGKIMPCHRCHMPKTEIDADCYTWMDHSFFGIQGELRRVLLSHEGVKESEIKKFTEDNARWVLGNMPELDSSMKETEVIRRVLSGGSHFSMALESVSMSDGALRLKFSTLNRNAGHDFPSSLFANIAEVWYELEVLDGRGRKLFFSGFSERDYTHRLGRVEIDEFKRPITPADSLKYVEIVNRKFLRPGIKYFDSYAVPVERRVQYPLTVRYRLMYRRYSSDFARWFSGGAISSFPARAVARRDFKIGAGMSIIP